MDGQPADLHRYTPTLLSVDPRGLAVRSVTWHRKQAADLPVTRITHAFFDPAGRPVGSHDPRLWEAGASANLVNIHSLTAQVLTSDSVDAGWRVSLPGEGGEELNAWDGRGTARRVEYDELLRPTGVFENDLCVERLTYGDGNFADHNQCGQLIRHDDPAGSRLNSEFGLTGAVIEQTQHFLKDLTRPDWPEAEVGRDALLEPGDGSTTRWRFNPLGDGLEHTDAQGNVQRFAQTVAGQLQACSLQLNGGVEQTLVSDIRYDAQGRVESETAGNGVISTALYGEKDGRLLELKAARGGEPLQDLMYDYDPVGNVIRLEDRAQPIRYFANQRIEPVSAYQYDTLYQLIEATGRELAQPNHGPVLPEFQNPADPTQLANYTQTYDYDAGGNLKQLTHVGSQSHSRTLVTARDSNRSLPVDNNQPPSEEDIAAAFDANGNLLKLQAGQTLDWNSRNQLQEVRPVVRESGIDDSERYVYDASGQRQRKVRTTQARAVTHIAEVRYLPGLEIRTDTATGETLNVITVQAGRNSVRVLHWQAGKPDAIANDHYRYSLTDHLNSSILELDAQAQIISQESYYPFGGTSWWAGRSAIEAHYKTVRYSGKERDSTGLYDYGQRYYAPWLQRWINPDPAGAVDGLNLFRFVRNSPLRYVDTEGADPHDVIVAQGFSNFSLQQQVKLKNAVDVAVDLLRLTVTELGKDNPAHGVSKAFTATFGRDLSTELKDITVIEVRAGLSSQQQFLSSLLKPEIATSLALFDTDSGRVAATLMSASKEFVGMRISREHLESHHVLMVAHTLMHEASHAVGRTLDVFYHDSFPLQTAASPEEVQVWSKAIRKNLKHSTMSGPAESKFDPSSYQAAMLAIGENVATLDSRIEVFGDPGIRTSLLRMNADTYAGLVMASKLPGKLMAKRIRREERLQAGGQRVA